MAKYLFASNGKKICEDCSGTGDCPECNGSGIDESLGRQFTDGMAGTFHDIIWPFDDNELEDTPCPACEGSGKCTTCDGDCEIDDDDDDEDDDD